MEKSIENLYNVEKLKEAYEKSAIYLSVQQKFENFEKQIKKMIDQHRKKLEEKHNLSVLLNRVFNLKRNIESFDSIDTAYEKYFNGKTSLEYVEKILNAKKDLIDAENQLQKTKDLIDTLSNSFKKDLILKTKNEYKNLKQNVIEKGLVSICFDPINWVNHKNDFTKNDYPYIFKQQDIEKFKECLLKNKFFYSNYHTYENYNDIGMFQMIQLWFDDLPSFMPLEFSNKKINTNMPSPFEYFLSKLNYQKITIVTNNISKEYWKRDDVMDDSDWGTHYYVYAASIIAPKKIAEKLKKTEKFETKKHLEKLFEKNQNIIVLSAGEVEYGKTNFKPKFTEQMREKIKNKINKTKNSIPFAKMFGYSDDYYDYCNQKTFTKIPNKNIANAIFETMEYMNKLEENKKTENLEDEMCL